MHKPKVTCFHDGEHLPFLIPLMEAGYRLFAYYRLPLTGKKRVM